MIGGILCVMNYTESYLNKGDDMRRKWISIPLICIALISCAQIGKLVGGLLTGSTADLKSVSMIAQHVSNSFTPEMGLTSGDFMPEGWKGGENFAAITFLNRDGIGLSKIDGVVKNESGPLNYIGLGSYGGFIEGGEEQITVTTTSGQSSSFKLTPQLPVKITSIAGGTNIVDRTKDLVIELENPAGHENTMIRVMVLMDIAGTTDWAELGHYRSADKIIVQKEDFKHPAMPDNLAGGIRDGESWLAVERYTVHKNVPKEFGAAQIRSINNDYAKVTVSEEPEDVITAAFVDETVNNFKIDLSKPNAYTGKPLGLAKKFAIASFAVRATKLKQKRVSTSSSSYYSGGYKYTTTVTTTRTRAFPKLPKERWDYLTTELYNDFVAQLRKSYNIELIPIEQVTSSENYKLMFPIEDKMSEAAYTGTYGGTKSLIPTTLGEIIGSASSTFASDRPDARLVKELGVDGLISVTIDFEMPWFDDLEEVKLNPRMAIRITGGAFGYNYGPIVYAQGVISGPGQAFDGENLTIDFLEKTIRKDELMDAFGQAFGKLKAEESKLGYDKVWGNRDF